jgi:hypothetical protein
MDIGLGYCLTRELLLIPLLQRKRNAERRQERSILKNRPFPLVTLKCIRRFLVQKPHFRERGSVEDVRRCSAIISHRRRPETLCKRVRCFSPMHRKGNSKPSPESC